MQDTPLGGTNEPNVAVNPTNPANLAYASLWELRVSNDGGNTWEASVPSSTPPTHSFGGGDPVLAFDGDGRLFWTYLGRVFDGGIDVFVAQCDAASGAILPGYPINVTSSPNIAKPALDGFVHDKQWLAVDTSLSSPFRGRLHLAWTEFVFTGETVVWSSFSDDEGFSWSATVQISLTADGFVWPVHNAVAPNGDVYTVYHDRDAITGLRGRVVVLRSINGGASYTQRRAAYTGGQADVTFNVQHGPNVIPGAQFWLQGNAQAWVLPDPHVDGRIYIVAADDPDDMYLVGDPSDIFVVVSTDHGKSWEPPRRIDSGPGTSFQVMPTAAIDPDTGLIAVHYYDNRNGLLNRDGRYMLDVFATFSLDGGLTFLPDFQVNELPFDPDPGAPIRFSGPPPTFRIGEYNGVVIADGRAHAVWCGNTFDLVSEPSGQQTIHGRFPVPVEIEVLPAMLNLASRGVTPLVALTTPSFDATTIDPLSVTFGPAGAREAHGRGHVEDVDGDGDLDLVLHFVTQAIGLGPGVTEGRLEARTTAGVQVEGITDVQAFSNLPVVCKYSADAQLRAEQAYAAQHAPRQQPNLALMQSKGTPPPPSRSSRRGSQRQAAHW